MGFAMTLPAAVTNHHTVWVHELGGSPRAVRYAVDDDRLVCFGDRELAELPDGSHVMLAIHEIAGGPSLVEFGATLRAANPGVVETSALYELLDHVSLGHDRDEIEASFVAHSRRRLVELVP
jgi:hypothetical protein